MKTKMYLGLIAALILGLSSCKKDDDSGTTTPAGPCANYTNWATGFQAELTAMTNAAQAYATDPTTANCEAYKAAANDYIDALEGVRTCVAASQLTAYNTSIQQARDAINALSC